MQMKQGLDTLASFLKKNDLDHSCYGKKKGTKTRKRILKKIIKAARRTRKILRH